MIFGGSLSKSKGAGLDRYNPDENTGRNAIQIFFDIYTAELTLSETGSGTYIVKQGGANLPRMTFGFENYQNCPQMYIKWLLNEYLAL